MCVYHGTCGNVIRKYDLHMLGAPRYSLHKVQMAYFGQPFYFDFNYPRHCTDLPIKINTEGNSAMISSVVRMVVAGVLGVDMI